MYEDISTLNCCYTYDGLFMDPVEMWGSAEIVYRSRQPINLYGVMELQVTLSRVTSYGNYITHQTCNTFCVQADDMDTRVWTLHP